MAHFEVWITIVLSLGMSLVRVEPKNILPYLLGFKFFFRESSRWILFEASLVWCQGEIMGTSFCFTSSRRGPRNSETNWLALQAAEIRGG